MSTTLPPDRMAAGDTALAVIDVQDKLLPKVLGPDALVRNVSFLLDAAKLLGVPAFATEQYPKGLGPTTPALACKLPSPLPDKLTFSSCGAAPFVEALRASGRPNVLVCGMETHVCVLQTVLDLLALSYRVFVPADGVSGRFALDHDIALRRMERAGAVVVTCESAVFEWTGAAGTNVFKDISRLVQDRMRAMGS